MSLLQVPLPGWPTRVRVYYSTRHDGHSSGRYRAFNLGQHVGDDPCIVDANRQHLLSLFPQRTRVCWLNQVHGAAVVEATSNVILAADGHWTAEAGLACAIMSADCLPVLLSDVEGQVVAAIHVGWRGLTAGVIEATINHIPVPATSLLAWLGPAIGRAAFEIGPEVRDALVTAYATDATPFLHSEAGSDRFFADLRGLATCVLRDLGVTRVDGENLCTFADPQRFYSHRRDGPTGRMVSLVLHSDA